MIALAAHSVDLAQNKNHTQTIEKKKHGQGSPSAIVIASPLTSESKFTIKQPPSMLSLSRQEHEAIEKTII
jgi:hypothetical protein